MESAFAEATVRLALSDHQPEKKKTRMLAGHENVSPVVLCWGDGGVGIRGMYGSTIRTV